MLATVFMMILLSGQTIRPQELQPTPNPAAAVSVLVDGTLTVYYGEIRQLLVYRKVAEDTLRTKIATAEVRVDQARLVREGYSEASAELNKLRQQALSADQSYSCVLRYEIRPFPPWRSNPSRVADGA